MADIRVSVSCGTARAVVKIQPQWTVEELVSSLRSKLKIAPYATVRKHGGIVCVRWDE